jgi:hypothetical protein
MTMVLRLHEDRLSASGDPVYLPAVERAIYVIEGGVTVEFPDGCSGQSAGSAWLGSSDIALLPKGGGVRLLRWELIAGEFAHQGSLASAPGSSSELKLSAEVELDPRSGWLMRCDQVRFPKGGIAFTHVHQGPGIRYCLEGQIEIQTEGSTHHYGPGEPWFESGASPVLAPTSEELETAFVRCFVLPRSCKSRTSIRYVNPEDASKPKTQRYKVMGERFIELPV